MKITEIRPILISAPYSAPGDIEPEVHGFKDRRRPACLVRIQTDAGISGVGETYAGVYSPESTCSLIEEFAQKLVGVDPLDSNPMAGIRQQRGLKAQVLSGIEIGLWDLRGKALGVPAYQLLGGKVHKSLPIYASGGNDQPWDGLRAELEKAVADGFCAVKIRIGRLSVQEAARKVEFCRNIIGSDIGLAVDATCWYKTVKEAISVVHAIEQFDILFLEQPIKLDALEKTAELRRRTDIPIASGEEVTCLKEVEEYLDTGAVDLLQPDAAHIGGINPFKQAAEMCAYRGIPVAVHSWAGGVGMMANYHLAFTLPNCSIVECSVVPNPLRDAFLVEPLRIKNGHVAPPPNAPGLGIDVPDDVESRFPYQGAEL